MTQREAILDLFQKNGNRLTLGEILSHPYGYEFRARATELRREGYRIECVINRAEPSKNLYVLTPPEKPLNATFYKEENGQGYLMDLMG